jgi:hypothetical protein
MVTLARAHENDEALIIADVAERQNILRKFCVSACKAGQIYADRTAGGSRSTRRAPMIARLVVPLVAAALVSAAPALAEDAEGWRLDEALGTPNWLTVSGSHRIRHETLNNQFRPGMTGSDQAIVVRTLLRADLHFGTLGFVGEFEDSRGWLMDDGSAISSSMINSAELLQGYARLRFDDLLSDGSKTELQFGRWTRDVGSGRLMGRHNFRNTIDSYTGVNFDWKAENGRELFLFWALPVAKLPADAPSLLDNEIEFDDQDFDLQFWGASYNEPKLFLGGNLELYFFGLNERDDPLERETRNRKLYTPGTRWVRAPKAGKFDWEIENGVQFGTSRNSSSPADVADLDVFAHYHHFDVGYTFEAPWSPHLLLEYDLYSGDPDPADDEINRFDPLFGPRRFDLGPSDFYGPFVRANLNSPGVRLEVKPSKRADAFVFYRAVWLDEARDAFGQGNIRDPSGASGKFAGQQIEARLRYWIVPQNVRLDIGGAVFFNGSFIENAPNATGEGDTTYAYVDLELTF